MHAITCYEQNLSFAHPSAHPDHACFDRTTYDNINGLAGGTTYVPGPNIWNQAKGLSDCYMQGVEGADIPVRIIATSVISTRYVCLYQDF